MEKNRQNIGTGEELYSVLDDTHTLLQTKELVA